MLIAFDLDGTLVDSVGDLAAALDAYLADAGFGPAGVGLVRRIMGAGAHDLIALSLAEQRIVLSDSEIDDHARRFLERYQDHDHTRSRLYPDARTVLEGLKATTAALAVVTNKPIRPAGRLLAKMGIDGLFDCVIGGDSTPALKPSPLPLLAAMAAVGRDADRTVMVGDSVNDIATARAAGAKVIGCRYGFPRAQADLDGADTTILALIEVPEALRRLGFPPAPS